MKNSRRLIFVLVTAAAVMLHTGNSLGSEREGFDLSVIVDGTARPEYRANGTVYVEASRDRDYALRLTNSTPRRVAVALAVDGLNTIDAKHTDAQSASKWVIEPYDTIEIAGWQVSDRSSRRFFFTGERNSYGATLGQTDNLGLIEAVVFREKLRSVRMWHGEEESRDSASRQPSRKSSGRGDSPRSESGLKASAADEYAATGMGDKTAHRVRAVDIDLEGRPSARVRIRYEFYPQLVDLGILPDASTPLERREQSRGFEGFCPDPGR